ncbi:MAG TPA: diphthamide synthesis protein [Candidatus Nanoarchaeia archaeon]|nr:diphthamide synthesis protein [Candidatus Nanoarchaeia archaeon]
MVELLLIDAKWEGKIKLTDELKEHLKKNKIKSVALFASVQFTDLKDFIKELEENKIKVNITKAKRTNEKMQILGCDCYEDSFQDNIIENSDAILYIGDGLFHPKALLLSQIKSKNFKPIIIFDPIANKIKEINKKDIEKQIQKYKRNLKLFINSKTLGILVTIKPGQQYLNSAKNLKEKLKEQGKKAYIFIDNNINLSQLENYPFIQCWVNTACPRIGTDDILNIEKPLINIKEAFEPIKALEELDNEK